MALQIGSITVPQQPTTPVDSPASNYSGLNPSTTLLPKGHQKAPGYRALPSPIIFNRDAKLPLRDGINLRADVFRPEGDEKVPALVAWSPYGKLGAGINAMNYVQGRVGIPQSMLSGYEKFEAPDPAEWVQKGYAIVNVDSRGGFDSEGDLRWLGTAEGRDGYDAIEEIAKLPWCNGKVALVGNSWLAMAQWFIAAEQPPHLTCIAPLEGASDLYKEILCRGGVPAKEFAGFIASQLYGRSRQESILGMLAQYPHMNEYWENKRAKIENIDVPAYILASYSTGLHTVGSFRGFEDIRHNNKWLRVHSTQEWHDLYQPSTNDDLQLFFDHFTKGIDNGWEKTSPVRVCVLNFTPNPIINQPFSNWPIPNTKYTKLYLSQSDQLTNTPPTNASMTSYQADAPALQVDADSEEVLFSHTFNTKTHLIGYPKVTLHMSGEATDMDVFVQLRKASPSGKLLQNINIPLKDLGVTSASEVAVVNPNIYLGPTGILRASRRAIDDSRSKPYWAVHAHTKESEQLVKPGEVVRMEIGCWPMGMVFEAGEKLVLKVAGHPMVLAEFEPLRGKFAAENKGRHVVYFGGQYDSHVVIPVVDV
ncbi:Alpha/Beta hydrolase protein [Halenospora varia]|nr:Alpha/Beta hydrolase protein [Halenospora varia]